MKKMMLIFLLLIASTQFNQGWAQENYILDAVQLIRAQPGFAKQLKLYLNEFDKLTYRHGRNKKAALIQDTQAQYLAFLSQNHDEHLVELLKLYKTNRWKHKQALLAIFKKLSHPKVKELLLSSALQETDEEAKLTIEKIAYQSQPVQMLYNHAINNTNQLAQYWTGYMATGNTQVVQATIEVLSNSVTGFSTTRDGTGKILKRVLPHRKRLREQTVSVIKYFINSDKTLRDHCLASNQLFDFPEMKLILPELAELITHSTDSLLLGKIIALMDSEDEQNQQALDYYKALKLGAQGDFSRLRHQVTQLERKAAILALPLKGHYHRMMYNQDKLEWKKKPLSKDEKDQAGTLMGTAVSDQSWQSYEYWNKIQPARDTILHKPIVESILGYDNQKDQKVVFHKLGDYTCWFLNKDQVYRYNNHNKKWYKIYSELIKQQLLNQFKPDQLKRIIEKQEPVSWTTIEQPKKNDLILAQYKNLPNSNLIQATLAKLDLGPVTLSSLDVYVDKLTGKLISYELVLALHAKSTYQIKVTRLFYDIGQTNFNWIKIKQD